MRVSWVLSIHLIVILTCSTISSYIDNMRYAGTVRGVRALDGKNSTYYITSEKRTQQHVFLGLTKNTGKHFCHLGSEADPKTLKNTCFWVWPKPLIFFYHLRQGRAIHNTQYKYNTIQYNSLTIRINTQYTKCLEGNTCIIKSLSKKLFLTILNPQNWENLHRLFWFPIANFAIDRAWSN